LEVDVQQGSFKIIQLLPQVLILFFGVEKWIPPSRLETAKIGHKKRGILGIKYLLEKVEREHLGVFCKRHQKEIMIINHKLY
jgi:hypothetical protein